MRRFRSPTYQAILAGYVLGAVALFAAAPGRMTPMVAFLLPTAGALIDLLLRGLLVRHPVGGPPTAALAAHDSILLRVTVFIMGLHATMLLGSLGLLRVGAWAPQLIAVMLGLTLMSVGNLLPRTRPNLAIGIRTGPTLSDRALWIRTHRSAGYMIVLLGTYLVLSAVALPAPVGARMVAVVVPATALGVGLIVRYTRKGSGSWNQEGGQ